MNFLLTGSAGFIGYHLCLKLLQNGHRVIGIDNLNTYYDRKLKLARLKNLEKFKNKSKLNYQFYKVDICDELKLKKIFNKFKFDAVIHLAAQAGVRYSLKNPKQYIHTNLNGFFNIIENTKIKKIKKFIYASSSSIYGSNKIPFKERDKSDKPIQLYAATKKSNELIATSYSHLYKFQTIGLRYFTVFGPYGRPDMALYKFTKNILENKKIEIFNKGIHKRDFTYIDDAVEMTVKLIDSKLIIKKHGFASIFNIGTNNSIKLLKLIELLEKKLKKKAKKKYLPLQQGDMIKTQASTKKLFDVIGRIKGSSLNRNLDKYLDWFKKFYN